MIKRCTFPIILCLFVSSLYAQPTVPKQENNSADSIGTDCSPNISVFEAGSRPQIFCLNKHTPSGSYCADLRLILRKSGIGVRFHCDKQKRWTFEGAGNKKEKISIPVNVEINSNRDGWMINAAVYVGNDADSARVNIIPQYSGDRRVVMDSLPELDYVIDRRLYLCIDKPQHKVITDRKFTYPAGYMRRGPQLGYPELYWFHHGTEVKMPSSASIRERGELVVIYHVLHPPEIKSDNLQEQLKLEARRNRQLNKRWQKKMRKKDEIRQKNTNKFRRRRKKKNGWFKIKPLR
ncbi:MAG: hypothetical protein ACLFSB_06980 [Chitinispirillaceae bacterium]